MMDSLTNINSFFILAGRYSAYVNGVRNQLIICCSIVLLRESCGVGLLFIFSSLGDTVKGH
jgi:hypothetical protein